jgi:hypothetical protein
MEEIQIKKKLAQEKIDLINSIKKEDFIEVWQNLYEVEIPDPVKRDTPTWSNYLDEFGFISEDTWGKFVLALQKQNPEAALDLAILFNNHVSWLDGEAVYHYLDRVLWSDKAASKFLESLWYDWIHYFWGRDWEAYVIFNDDALQITKHHKY